MWGADTREHAKNTFARFCATWEAKYPKAVACLAQDEEELFAFYDFPAAHWRSIRTTNPIESTFSTIRLRTAKTRNCLSEKSAMSLVHQLAMSAEKRWRPLHSGRPYTTIDSNSWEVGADHRGNSMIISVNSSGSVSTRMFPPC